MIHQRWMVAAGTCACVALGLGAVTTDTSYARGSRTRSQLRVVSISVSDTDQVALNDLIEIRFNRRVSQQSLTNGAITVLPHNVDTGELGAPRPGDLTRRGNIVRFIPRLPTHARTGDDPSDPFFPPGSPRDDAYENASFRTATNYVVRIAGRPATPAAASTSGAVLRSTVTASFRTTDGDSPETPAFRDEAYVGVRLPAVLFTSPPDTVASARSLYRVTGGTPRVPTDVQITLFGGGVPLDPETVRAPGAVELLLVETEYGSVEPTPVPGDAILEQDRNRSNLIFRPSEPLAERSTYALRVAESVTDLTGRFHLIPDARRGRLGETHAYLAVASAIQPGTPVEFLPDPSIELIFDWPSLGSGQEARGVLKRNVLDLGDLRPWEVDPRVYAVFTTTTSRSVPTPPAARARDRANERRAPLAEISRVITPLGLQGVAGAGPGVVIPFTLTDSRGRAAFIEVQYGVDRDEDGVIEEDEYAAASIDIRDPRLVGETGEAKTRRSGPRFEFAAAPGSGRSNAVVWNSIADIGRSALDVERIAHTPQGREIQDPPGSGTPLYETGSGGVIIRIRTVRGGRRASEWSHTTAFDVNNASRPMITLDAVQPGTPALIDWSAQSNDSEDANNNGELEPVEDENGDGVLETAPMGVAFDFHVLDADEDPTTLSATELAQLDWQPCSRADGVGDADVGLTTSRNGVPYTFAWDRVADGVQTGSRVILRARPFDAMAVHGPWVYANDPVTLGE